jgi:small subunit ribosomal protein S2
MHIPSEKELFKAGVHFGHKTSNWHPKMADFIFGSKNGVHIIDLEKTRTQLEKALKFVNEISKSGKKILFIGTRIQSKNLIKKHAEEKNMPYVSERWLGGTLTNQKTIYGMVKKLKNLEKQAEKEDYEKKFTKKERQVFKIQIEKLKKDIGGIYDMENLPDALFISSARYEKTAIAEANKKNIPIVAICDTNSDPSKITYPIPANDDSIKSLELIISLIAENIK